MKKTICFLFCLILFFSVSAHAQGTTDYIVQPGDSMWKIAVKHQVGLSEIIQANPQIKNPALIYPGQKIIIPDLDQIKNLENEVIRLVNVERQKYGLAPLKANWELSRVARFKSMDMVEKNYFSHVSPTYGSPFKMITDFGLTYSSAGENIAMGQKTPAAVMKGWMNSSGHRANILNSTYTEIGVGLAVNKNGQNYWTQMFIRPRK